MSALDEPQVPLIKNEKKSRFGTFISRSLPEYTGPLPVGVCDIELPVPRQTFGSFQHAKMPGQSASLVMDSVLFSVFYPCVVGDGGHEKQVWFPKCVVLVWCVADTDVELGSSRQLMGYWAWQSVHRSGDTRFSHVFTHL